ncbi:MAG: DUF2513 domain-containing protein [Pontiellaceae bacterium]|nr:DUF2513 domain-containing protein [Pontiellaceae bacterium]
MRRDMDLIRDIMFKIEESENNLYEPFHVFIDGVDDETVSYHVWLLDDAGLILAENATTCSGYEIDAKCLTWKGHEFLQSIRDDTVWNKAKEKVLKPAASWSFTLLSEWLKMEASHKLGLS